MAKPQKTLRESLPQEFFNEYMDTPAAQLLDVPVKKTHDPRKTP